MNFADLLTQESKWSITENGEECKNTTDNPLLDLFATIGALRSRSEDEIVKKFLLAYAYDPLLAVRCVFYARDIRGGLGERNTFRVLLNFMGSFIPKTVKYNLDEIPDKGRWDDLYSLIGTEVEDDMWDFVKAQLDVDMTMTTCKCPIVCISLLAKWLKKADSKSKNTKALGIYTAHKLGFSVYEYKRICNFLRKQIGIVECQMSANEWDKINYPSVPSRSMMNYRNAFRRHDEERFDQYINNVSEGKEKINSSTLFPYDIVYKVMNENIAGINVLEEQWKALPNYIDGEYNVLVMADVSRSMFPKAICSSIGLALYFAERNKGAYHNLFMTFSENPRIVYIPDFSKMKLYEKIKYIERSDWGNNTNLYKAFNRILEIALKGKDGNGKEKCPKEEMPKALIVISDMEIDAGCAKHDRKTTSQKVKEMFEEAGYDCPKLVYWNVQSRNDTFLADKDDANTLLVSGQSPSVFKQVMKSLDKTPEDMMKAVLNSERYAMINLGVRTRHYA